MSRNFAWPTCKIYWLSVRPSKENWIWQSTLEKAVLSQPAGEDRPANFQDLSVRLTQLPNQNWTIWVRNAWDFCPNFTSLIYVIIEPKIAPFPISSNCPTLRLASLLTIQYNCAWEGSLTCSLRVVWTHSMQQDLIHNQFLSNIFTGNILSDLSPVLLFGSILIGKIIIGYCM